VILPGRRSVVVGRIVHRSAAHHAGRDLERYLIHSSGCRMYPKYTSDLGSLPFRGISLCLYHDFAVAY
jgi:hypothetical protein